MPHWRRAAAAERYLRVLAGEGPSASASAVAQPNAMTASPLCGLTVPTTSAAALPPAFTALECSTAAEAPFALSRNLRSS